MDVPGFGKVDVRDWLAVERELDLDLVARLK